MNRMLGLLLLLILSFLFCAKNNLDLKVHTNKDKTIIQDFNSNKLFTINNNDGYNLSRIMDTLDKTQMELVRHGRRDRMYQKGITISVDSNMSLLQFQNVIAEMGSHGIGNLRQPVNIDETIILVDFDMFLILGDYNNAHHPLPIFPKAVITGENNYEYIPIAGNINRKYSCSIDVVVKKDISMKHFLKLLNSFGYSDYQSIRIHKDSPDSLTTKDTLQHR
jgi:hypothetical protein